MSLAAQRRLALALLVVLVLCAPGLAIAGPRAQAGSARPVATPASSLGAVFDRLRDLLHQLWEGRGGAGDARATTGAGGLQNVHANAGCGIDPNGDGCPHG